MTQLRFERGRNRVLIRRFFTADWQFFSKARAASVEHMGIYQIRFHEEIVSCEDFLFREKTFRYCPILKFLSLKLMTK